MQTISKQQFEIPAANLDVFQQKMAAFQKKAVKLGLPPLSINEIGQSIQSVKIETIDTVNRTNSQRTVSMRVHTFEIEGVVPKIDGWRFGAMLEFVDGLDRPIINNFTNDWTPPARYSDENCQPDCDHCQTKRSRKKTFLLINDADQSVSQIGSNCLGDFFPHSNPEWVASANQFILEIYKAAEIYEDAEFSNNGHQHHLIALTDVLAHALQSIEDRGYFSAEKAESMMMLSTADHLRHSFSGKPGADIRPTTHNINKAREIADFLQSDEFKQQAVDNSFLSNLSVFADSGKMTFKHIGIAAAAPLVYQRHIEEQHRYQSEFIGEVGQKLQDYPVTLAFTTVLPGYMEGSTKTLMVFRDQQGNQLNWFCQGIEPPFLVGETVHLNGTIKGHSQYKGVDQTVLTRCTFNEFRLLDAMLTGNDKAFKKLIHSPLNGDIKFNDNLGTFLFNACVKARLDWVTALVNKGVAAETGNRYTFAQVFSEPLNLDMDEIRKTLNNAYSTLELSAEDDAPSLR